MLWELIFFSIQLYPENYFEKFNPATKFKKWAAIEVGTYENIPSSFETLIIPSGLYAIFIHKGLSADFSKTMNYIISEWLPNSEYKLDNRPYFEILGKKYKNNDPSSEEEVWIPIQKIS